MIEPASNRKRPQKQEQIIKAMNDWWWLYELVSDQWLALKVSSVWNLKLRKLEKYKKKCLNTVKSTSAFHSITFGRVSITYPFQWGGGTWPSYAAWWCGSWLIHQHPPHGRRACTQTPACDWVTDAMSRWVCSCELGLSAQSGQRSL